jgi:hypothetical protein
LYTLVYYDSPNIYENNVTSNTSLDNLKANATKFLCVSWQEGWDESYSIFFGSFFVLYIWLSPFIMKYFVTYSMKKKKMLKASLDFHETELARDISSLYKGRPNSDCLHPIWDLAAYKNLTTIKQHINEINIIYLYDER